MDTFFEGFLRDNDAPPDSERRYPLLLCHMVQRCSGHRQNQGQAGGRSRVLFSVTEVYTFFLGS